MIAVEGLAPGFLDVEGSLFLSSKGELMAFAEGACRAGIGMLVHGIEQTNW